MAVLPNGRVSAPTPKPSPAARRTQDIQAEAWDQAHQKTIRAMALCRAAGREDLVNEAIMLTAVKGASLDEIKRMIADASWDRAFAAMRSN
jgi:hypothetical protein